MKVSRIFLNEEFQWKNKKNMSADNGNVLNSMNGYKKNDIVS